jgi:hypothetical protein
MKRSLFALALAAILPVSAQAAEGLSFTYVEADYVSTDAFDTDMKGFGLKGNAAFHENWYGTASWSRASKGDVDFGYIEGPVDLDFEQASIGIGFTTDIGKNVAFLAELAYLGYSLEAEIPSIGTDDERFDGYRATAGVRALLGEKFELEGKAHYADLEYIDGSFGAEINGTFHINDTWGVGAGFATQDFDGDDANQWHVGVRASF